MTRPTIALALLLVAAASTPAAAQLRLPKVGKVAEAADVPTPRPSTGSGSGPRTGEVEFNSQVLEITPGVVDRLARGLAAEREMAARVEGQDLEAMDRENEALRKAHERERAAFEKRHRDWKACTEEVGRKMSAAMGPMPTAQDQKALEAVAERVRAAKERGDMAEVMRLTDSLTRAIAPTARRTAEVSNAGYAEAASKCGPEPVAPPSPEYRQPLDYRSVREAGLKAAGMTDAQYSILRERVVPFVVDKRSYGGMVYTKDEVATLEAHAPKLEPFADILARY